MGLFGIGSYFVTDYFDRTIEKTHFPVPMISMQLKYVIAKPNTDRAALKTWLLNIHKRYKSDQVFIIDDNDKPLFPRPLPNKLQEALLNQSYTPLDFFPSPLNGPMQNHNGVFDPARMPDIIIKQFFLANGERYRLAFNNSPSIEQNHLFHSLDTGGQLLLATIVSGIICFLLARYLTRPLKTLCLATQNISQGYFHDSIPPEILVKKDEIGELGRHINQMSGHLEMVILTQQRLLRDISHELRSPIARLQIALELAHRRSNNLISYELERMETEIERMNDLVSQSLSLAHLNNQFSLEDKCRLDLNRLVREAVTNADYEAQDKQSSVTLSEFIHCHIEGNYELLFSAIENILRNAVHYTRPQTTVEAAINTMVKKSPDTVIITIRDYGTGVPEVDIESLFKPFFRSETARTNDSGGFGVGLAIADRAIYLHNGKISVENAPGGGLLMTIYLPIASLSEDISVIGG